MQFVIALLEKEKTKIEHGIRHEELLCKNRKQAIEQLRNVGEIKKAIKILKARSLKIK